MTDRNLKVVFSTSCGGDSEHWYETYEGLAYMEHLTSYVRTMFNSDDGPLFLYDVDAEFDVTDYGVTYPLHLREHLRVEFSPGLDLTVRDIEVTQGLQLQNTIPLVQQRPRSDAVRGHAHDHAGCQRRSGQRDDDGGGPSATAAREILHTSAAGAAIARHGSIIKEQFDA